MTADKRDMFRWCSYCQTYMGETAPREIHSPTHGICPGCKTKFKAGTAEITPGIKKIVRFFNDLQTCLKFGLTPDPQELIDQAAELGIRPQDLLAGMLQPLLYEIGTMYATGQVTARAEHAFSMFVEDVIHRLKIQLPRPQQADVLLFSADGNYHSFGIRFLELALQEEGVYAKAVFPSMPFSEMFLMAQEANARVVGISFSMKDQLQALGDIRDYLSIFPENEAPLVVLGGLAVDPNSMQAPSGAILHDGELSSFLALVVARLGGGKKAA